jgi:hypothetical protein
MRTVFLLGIPSAYVGTAKSAIAKNATLFNAWAIKYIPSSRKEAEILQGMVRRAQELADQQENPHIVGFSAQKDRQHLADQLKPYFRFRWFDHDLLKCLGSPDPSPFVQELASNLAQESEWATRIKPSDLNSPLLLPECSFEPGRKYLDLWRHAAAYGDPQNIVGAEKAIKGFRNAHRRKINFKSFSSSYKWVDERDRIFDEDGPRHGIAPFPMSWKYSYKMEPGFHFDVTQVNGHRFELMDATGRRNRVDADDYLNLDPHGYVRL